MNKVNQLLSLTEGFSPEKLLGFLRLIAPNLRPQRLSLSYFLKEDSPFDEAQQIGVIELPGMNTVIVATVHVKGELTNRSGKRKQYELAKRILKDGNHNAGIFAFYDDDGRFRLSLVTVTYHGTRRRFSTFRRYTFFVDPELANKTFIQQFRKANFSSLERILETFSLEAVSDEFYKEFKPKFDALAHAVQGTDNPALKQDFALLFVIRTIFLGFVQKKGWLGNNTRFLQDFWKEYKAWRDENGRNNRFYRDWLEPLFFEALSSPPGQKVANEHAPFSGETQKVLQMAPYLNGELFSRKRGIDDQGLWIPDKFIGDFFDFLFQYNFTVEENELYDEELELNPEFLGIIFERLTNMKQGAVYTPRIEVDLMCRLALVKWLSQITSIDQEKLYRLFFETMYEPEDEEQENIDLTPEEIRTLIERLESVTVCDPAAGSGAFEVGMLQVLDQTLSYLYEHPNAPDELRANVPSPFERKKALIARSLYGVEVKRWAVWINHLRLWLTLFVDMPDELQYSFEPLLPSLTFKVRAGDSLVQRIGSKTFPVHGPATLPHEIKQKINRLKQKKRDFFYNRLRNKKLIETEELRLFGDILNAEIEERQRKILEMQKHLRMLESPKLIDVGVSEKEIKERHYIEDEIETLRKEIEELTEQKRQLKEERPFIWSIEFAEIFFDRGGFDIIIGNPPYVRQEEITDPNGHIPPKEYKDALMEMVRLDFPEFFAKSRAETHEFKQGRKPSGHSDLYTYFYIRSLRLLNPQGIHVFICSNSWLDVGYGAWLQEFFLRKAPLYLVIDNHARRSFTRVDINTIITVAGAPLKGHRQVPVNQMVRFVAFKKSFEEVVNAENLLDVENATQILKTLDFRVFPITVAELIKEGSEPTPMGPGKYVGDKWGGKYLRAPDIFFTILEKGKSKLMRLGEVADVRFGIKTGANEFFYLEPLGPGAHPDLVRVRNGVGWEGEIEEEFLKPAIKSPREIKTIVIDPSKLKYRIFMCHKSKEELKGTKALEYIEWGENVEVKIKQGQNSGKIVRGFQNISTVKNRKPWYSLGQWKPPIGILPAGFNTSFVAYFNPEGVLADKRLYMLYGKKDFLVYLNSTMLPFMAEIMSRKSLGEGLLDLTVYEYSFIPILSEKFGNLENLLPKREIHDIFTECGIDPESDIPISEQEPNPLPDRKALDDIVFDALGLTEEERKEVYRAVCQLVWERISKARSVRRR